ncbi:MAG: lipocalin family protein [Gelidibacter sp.]
MTYSKTSILIAIIAVISSCSSDEDNVKNQAPNAFNLIEVADGTTNSALNPEFSWNAAIDPDGDTVSYELYLDTANPLTTLIAGKLSETNHTSTRAALNAEFLLGKWFLVNSEGEEPATACEKTSYSEFSNNGKNYTLLFIDGNDGSCIPFMGGEHNFELISENIIRFTHDDDGETFETEIVSISEDTMVLNDFILPDNKITFWKAKE